MQPETILALFGSIGALGSSLLLTAHEPFLRQRNEYMQRKELSAGSAHVQF